MNDETNPAPNEPIIPSNLEPEFPPFTSTATPAIPPKPLSYWLKKLLICNPFYLASAALLLYGISRISLDANFFTTEIRQLLFSFSALQTYELLLVGTVALLATRRIWYDASLLVALENLLWIVPFILLSQAAFIEQNTAVFLCLLACGMVVSRAMWLRIKSRDLVPPRAAWWCGLPILLVNATWPILCRHFGETKVGRFIASGAAYEFNEFNWFWLLPALAALILFLPRPDSLIAKTTMRRWFPIVLFLFWLLGTGVHLYALGYVYDFPLRCEQLVPVLWVLAWALQTRVTDFIVRPSPALSTGVLLLPLLATLPAAFAPGSRVFFYLSTVNLSAFAFRLLFQPDNRLVLQLGLFSFAAMIASAPIDFAPLLARPLAQTNLIGVGALVYVLAGTILSRNPKVAILGALAAMIGAGVLRQAHADCFHWALQAGLVYFLFHSLRWNDAAHPGAAGVRWAVAASWALHTFIWSRDGGTWIESLIITGIVLSVWLARGLILKRWQPLALPIAASLVVLCSPTNLLMAKTQAAPTGVLYVVGSFALFGIGTLAALTKHRWHKNHSIETD